MLAELVQTTTRDGLRLHGALHLAENGVAPRGARPIEVALCLHGVGSNFYSGSVIEHLARTLTSVGIDALRVNTRGHDGVNLLKTITGAVRQGAAFETVDDCRHDVAGWIRFLRDRGFQRTLVVGHSLGAIKAIYAAALDPDPMVRGIVAISPPRLSHQAFQSDSNHAAFQFSLAEAQQLVAEGRASQLFQARFPFPLLISAASYVDKYGPGERYNIVKLVDRVEPPLLVVYGGGELSQGGTAFSGVPEAIRAAARRQQPLELVTVPGADHNYAGLAAELGHVVTSWLASAARPSAS